MSEGVEAIGGLRLKLFQKIRGDSKDLLTNGRTYCPERPFRCSDSSSSAHLHHEKICIQADDDDRAVIMICIDKHCKDMYDDEDEDDDDDRAVI